MNRYRALILISAAALFTACETEDPTFALIENGYAQGVVVYKAWWETTLFTDPVLPGASSAEQRSVPESDTAYVLLAPGWDPAGGEPPKTLVPARSKAPLRVERGSTLRITVSDATFAGNCAAQQPLSQEDADFITQRIFPGEFATVTYDARTCTSTPIPVADSGVGDQED
jgi:hypothetical protein